MALRGDQGIVLRSYPFGEADKIVVLLSPNRGKLRTVAKGVRRTKSRFGGRLEPFTLVDLVLYEGRNLDTITQVAVIEAFPRLRTDLDAIFAAGTMVEIADLVAQEDEPARRLFLLLRRGLEILEGGIAQPDLVTAYLLKAAEIIGVAPSFTACARCGAEGSFRRFSFAEGGTLCEACRTPGSYALREGLTDHLAALATADLGALPEAPTFAGEARGVAKRFVEYHLERRIESMAIADA